MGNDGVALQRGFGIEHVGIHLLWRAVFEGVLAADVLYGGVEQYRAAVEDEDMVQQLFHVVHLVGGDHDGALVGHVLGDDLAELCLRWNVQSVCRFVHQQVLGLGGHGEGYVGLLALAHRQLAQVDVAVQFEVVQATLEHFVGKMWIKGAVEAHVFRQPDAGHLELLGHEEQLAQQLGLALVGCDIVTADRPLRGAQQTAEQVEQGRLARAVLAQQTIDAVFVQLEAEPVEDQLSLAFVLETDVVYVNHTIYAFNLN